MPSYDTASRTKDYFANQLIRDHPEIVSIAPRLALDDKGYPTSDGVIVIGVKCQIPRHDIAGTKIEPDGKSIPKDLPAVRNDGLLDDSERVSVVIEYEGEIEFEMNTARNRPSPCGFSISHNMPGVLTGTIGAVMRVDGNWGFILSNNHILANNNGATAGDNIWQPGQADGGTAADIIATLTRWVPIDFSGADNEVDCALAQVTAPWNNNVSRNVQGIGVPMDIDEASVGQNVRKSGRTTQHTTGSILSDNATLTLNNGARFVNQLQYSRMTAAGDSGAIIFDNSSLTVVGLHFAGSSSASYGNKISRVLHFLSDSFSVYSISGVETRFDSVTIEIA